MEKSAAKNVPSAQQIAGAGDTVWILDYHARIPCDRLHLPRSPGCTATALPERKIMAIRDREHRSVP